MKKGRLPVFDIFKQALSLTQRYSQTLIRFNLPWLIVSLLWTAFDRLVSSDNQSFYGHEWLSMVMFVALVGATVMAAVASHRTFLMGEEAVSGLQPIRWSHRETSFFAWSLFIALSGFMVLIPFLLAGFFFMPVLAQYAQLFAPLGSAGLIVAMMPVFIAMAFFVARWSLLLPAVALDEREGSFKWAWQLSKGNAWRMALLVFLLPFLAGLMKELVIGSESVILMLALEPVWIAFGVLEIGILSLSFRYLTEQCSMEREPPSSSVDAVLE